MKILSKTNLLKYRNIILGIASVIVLDLLFRPYFGLYNGFILSGVIVAAFALLWACITFILHKKGGLFGCLSYLYSQIASFIKYNAENYKSIKWYKSPRYWVVGCIIAYTLIYFVMFPSSFSFMSDGIIIWLPLVILLPFVIAGSVFSFLVVLGLDGLCFYSMIERLPLSANLSVICVRLALLVWMLAWGSLLLSCIIIEIKRKMAQMNWKLVLKGILAFLIWGVISTVIISTAVIISDKIMRDKHYEVCVNDLTKRDIDQVDAENYCRHVAYK